MLKDDVFKKAFSVTSWFECGETPFTLASGNFDKQGLSWGPRQNCIGQGSLQPLLRKMLKDQGPIMGSELGAMRGSMQEMLGLPDTKSQLAYVISQWNDDQGRLKPEWAKVFKSLGSYQVIQNIFMDDAKGSIPEVDQLASWIARGEAVTVRTWCLAFDFVTQNGGFNPVFKLALTALRLALYSFRKDDRDWMRSLCWLRAGWSYVRGNREFADDVLSRKLLIVEGHRKFRGEYVDLDAKFGISDEAI